MTGSDPGHIDVEVRLFGRYRSLLPDGCMTITLAAGCCLSDMFTELAQRVVWPDPKPLKDGVAEGTVIVLINGRHVPSSHNHELKADDVVGLVAPVAGG